MSGFLFVKEREDTMGESESGLSVEEKVAVGVGFNVGAYHIDRLDRQSDKDLANIRDGLLTLMDEAREALGAIYVVQGLRRVMDSHPSSAQLAD